MGGAESFDPVAHRSVEPLSRVCGSTARGEGRRGEPSALRTTDAGFPRYAHSERLAPVCRVLPRGVITGRGVEAIFLDSLRAANVLAVCKHIATVALSQALERRLWSLSLS